LEGIGHCSAEDNKISEAGYASPWVIAIEIRESEFCGLKSVTGSLELLFNHRTYVPIA